MMNIKSIRPLTHDDLRKRVPSAYAETPFHGVSDRYEYIPSYPLMDVLFNHGWQAIEAYESRARIAEKQGKTRHLVRLVHPDFKTSSLKVGDTFAAITFVNSHDATGAYKLMESLFRLACSNGMIRNAGEQSVMSIRHNRRAVERMREEMPVLLGNAANAAALVEEMADVTLTEVERGVFALAASELRWAPEIREEQNGDETVITKISTAPVSPDRLLSVRRQQDVTEKDTLWGTLNIVQENILKGGLHGRNASGNRMTTRAVHNVQEDVRLNRALWTLAEEMKKLKA